MAPRTRSIPPPPAFDMHAFMGLMAYAQMCDDDGQVLSDFWEDELYLRRVRRVGEALVLDEVVLPHEVKDAQAMATRRGAEVIQIPAAEAYGSGPFPEDDHEPMTVFRFVRPCPTSFDEAYDALRVMYPEAFAQHREACRARYAAAQKRRGR